MGTPSSNTDLPESFPVALHPLRAILLAPPVPRPLSSFVGRTHDIARIAGLLKAGNVRLLTVTGPGGVGKTRVAIEVAHDLGTVFADGIVFVPLAPVQDSSLVAAAIANQLDVPESPGIPLPETLTRFLGGKQILIILDNFEHVMSSALLLPALLGRCDGLALLVTSRTTLHVTGETELRLPPLPVPVARLGLRADELAQNESVRLFVDRATSAAFDFELTPANAATIAEICRQLDGLPLAIELAAARAKILSVPALLDRLTTRLNVLGRGPVDESWATGIVEPRSIHTTAGITPGWDRRPGR